MSIKQDRCKARTPMDLERRYKFGENMKKNNLQVQRMEKKSKELNKDINKFIEDTNKRFEEIKVNNSSGTSEGAHIYSGAPSLESVPASSWNDEEKKNNTGYIYCDLNTGKIYVFNNYNEEYFWIDCMANYYTKIQVDDLIPNLENYYDKSETDTKISESNTALYNSINNLLGTNYYTKTQVDDLIPNLDNYYTKTQVNSLIPSLTNYYTKSEVNSLIPSLDNYYNKSEVDTKISDTAYGLQTLISNNEQALAINYYTKDQTITQITTYNKNVKTEILNNIASDGLVLDNATYLRGMSTDSNEIRVAGVSSNNHVILGSGDGKAQNTHVYADLEINFYAQRASSSYQAHVLKIQREQSGSNRTIFRCETNGVAYLGTSGYRFNTAYFTNAITASDLKEKEVIEDYDFKYKDFIMSLKPIAYRRVGSGDNGKRIHLGLGAQDVAKCIEDLDLGNLSLVQASIVNDDGTESPYYGEDIDDNKLSWGINYTELFPNVILMLQDLYRNIQAKDKRIDEQDKRIKELENKVEELIKGTK